MAEDKALRRARSKLDRALDANRYDEALTLLAELRTGEPDNARWPHKHGDLLRKLGRNDDAVHCYETAISLYAEQGFIARAVAMAKTVFALNPARLDILERVDPQAAQLLRANKRPQRRHPLLDDAPLAPLPPAPPLRTTASSQRSASEPSGASMRARPHGARAQDEALPATVPRMPIRSLRPPPRATGHRPQPRAAESQPWASPLPKPRAAPPPVPAPQRPRHTASTTIELQLEDLYGDSASVLSIDPSAPPDQTRFSNDSSRRTGELRLSEIELAKRTPLPELPSLRPEPPAAETLANLPLFPLFAELPRAALARMIAGSELIELPHGALVLRQGDEGDALYGIVEGSVTLVVPGQDVQLTLAEGDVFGESSLLESDKYHADVIVMGMLIALRVPREVLLDMVEQHAPLAGLLLELLTRRLLGNLLQVSPLFHDFDARGKGELARLFEVRRAAAGTMLAVVGKKMDGLYISLTGVLRINQPGAPERAAPPGSMFGQNTFLTQSASQVDVIAASDMILLRLPQAQFTRVAMQYPTVLARLAELSTSEVVRVTM